MSDQKISSLSSASSLVGSELFPIVQSGNTKKTTLLSLLNTLIQDLGSGTENYSLNDGYTFEFKNRYTANPSDYVRFYLNKGSDNLALMEASNGTNTVSMQVSSNDATIQAYDGSNIARIIARVTSSIIPNNGSNNNLIITDTISSKGLVYSADYSANFTPESLASVRYNDATYLSLSGGTLTGNLNGITPTELGYLSGITSNVQNQINNINSGLSWKQSVKVATTANIALSGTQTIDGVSVIAGERVLVKDQSVLKENGIYVCSAGTWVRASDADTGNEILQATVSIQEGTVNADTIYTCSTNAPITIGVTSLAFVITSATTYTAGTGLSLSSNTFSISASYIGQSSITTLGTIGTGVWQGTSINTSYTDAKIKGSATSSGVLYSTATDTVTTDTTNFVWDSSIKNLKIGNAAALGFINSIEMSNSGSGPDGVFSNSHTGSTKSFGFYLGGDGGNRVQFYLNNSGVPGNYTGTSIPAANTARYISGASAQNPSIFEGSPIIKLIGQSSSNMGLRFSASGTRIDTLSNLHTDSSAALHVVKTTEQLRLGYDSTNYLSSTIASNGDASFDLVGTNPSFVFGKKINLKNYTVATLPSGTRGDTAYVTDALAPSYLATIVGGGIIVTPVFYNGSNWVAN